MALEPVIMQVNIPAAPEPVNKFSSWWQRHKPNDVKSTKIITALSAIVISIAIVTFAIFTILANNSSFKSKHGLEGANAPVQSSGTQKSTAALPGGGTAYGIGGCNGKVCPVITLSATPASVKLGATSHIVWSVTGGPKNCIASDDWSGTKGISGSEDTPALTKNQTYLFTLTCKTALGTGFSTVSVGTASETGGSGSVTARPNVTIAVDPSSIFTGQSATINWTATNNPTNCTASGDWSGVKTSTGTQSTGSLNSPRQYYYSMQCTNSSGVSSTVTTSLLVQDVPKAYVGLPIVTLSANPVGPITPGSSSVISWSTTNNPTSCTSSGDWTGSRSTSGTFNTGALNSIKTYTYTMTCSNSVGSLYDQLAIVVLPNPPAISLSVNPTSILVGSSSTITWNVTNTTAGTTCTASGDWPGSTNITPVSGGTRSTGVLNSAKTYVYSLSCKNEGGTGFQNNVPLTVSVPAPPVVSISVSPISINTGQSATISWSATNNPTSCTPSSDLTAPVSPLSGGSKSTGTLSTARTYTYKLQCSNAGGSSNVAQTSLSVGSGSSSNPPVVTIAVSPSAISTGSSATVSWSATNNPTSCSAGGTTNNWVTSPGASGSTSTGVLSSPGTRTYSITCTNSAGSGTGTTSPNLNVVALPTVSVSLGSTSINTGSSTTYSWSSTGASSCTGSGALSGSMGTSGGPITTGAKGTAGTYNYTVSCVNSIGGSTSATAVLTVSNAAPVYCGGQSPCYGVSDLAAHASPGNCWGWNQPTTVPTPLPWVINITSFRPKHPGGAQAGSLESASSTCNHDIHSILIGSAGISGYKDGNGNTSHSHSSATANNTSGSGLTSYNLGYYDATKP